MYNHAPKDYVCPLCQIASGQPTSHGSQEDAVFYRDEFLTAFIAGKWWRSNPGHAIIIPNKHFENLYELPVDIGHKIFDLSQKIAIKMRDTHACEGISTKQHNEPAGNQEAFHFHLHIIPRFTGDNHYLKSGDIYWPTPEEKKVYVDKLKKYL